MHHAIATKSFLALMGLYSYDQVLNNVFYINESGTPQTVRILRVIDDFHLAEREDVSSPLLIFIQNSAQRYAAIKLNNITDRAAVEKILKHYNVSTEQIKSANELHQDYFNNNKLMKETINMATLLSVILILISTIIVGTSETKRLGKTLEIMESIGGSIYTNVIFFIQQNLIPIVIAAGISLPISFLLLQRWLSQYPLVNSISYIYATSALIIFMLSVITVMVVTLIFSSKSLNILGNK